MILDSSLGVPRYSILHHRLFPILFVLWCGGVSVIQSAALNGDDKYHISQPSSIRRYDVIGEAAFQRGVGGIPQPQRRFSKDEQSYIRFGKRGDQDYHTQMLKSLKLPVYKKLTENENYIRFGKRQSKGDAGDTSQSTLDQYYLSDVNQGGDYPIIHHPTSFGDERHEINSNEYTPKTFPFARIVRNPHSDTSYIRFG